MKKSVGHKGNVEGTTGPGTSNVSLSAYLGKWIIRFHYRLGTWVPHVLEELHCWCLQSPSSCNYILHLLRMSRLNYKSWGGKKWLQLSVAVKAVRSPWWDPLPCVHRSRSPESQQSQHEEQRWKGDRETSSKTSRKSPVKHQWWKPKGRLPESSSNRALMIYWNIYNSTRYHRGSHVQFWVPNTLTRNL